MPNIEKGRMDRKKKVNKLETKITENKRVES